MLIFSADGDSFLNPSIGVHFGFRNASPVPLVESLVSFMKTSGSAPSSTPLPRVSSCGSGSDSVSMCSEGPGDVQGKSAKRKQKLAATPLPAYPVHRAVSYTHLDVYKRQA